MITTYQKIIAELRGKKAAPVYVIDGEENFRLDQITQVLEDEFLPTGEKDFNLSVFYGRDSNWKDVVNACRRHPMFAEKQVVILKDAAMLSELSALATYIANPAPTTVLLIEHRGKKVDGRGSFIKVVKEHAHYYTSEKIKEDHIPQWIIEYGQDKGFKINEQASQVIASYLGNDLQKIVLEIDKVRLNLADNEELTTAHVQKYIGISKDFNLFELPETFAAGNMERYSRMMQYFLGDAKHAPMPLVIGSFYNFYNQLYLTHFLGDRQGKDAAGFIKSWPSKVGFMKNLAKQWSLPKVEQSLLIISQYSAATVGIHHAASDRELLKEMMGKLSVIAVA